MLLPLPLPPVEALILQCMQGMVWLVAPPAAGSGHAANNITWIMVGSWLRRRSGYWKMNRESEDRVMDTATPCVNEGEPAGGPFVLRMSLIRVLTGGGGIW